MSFAEANQAFADAQASQTQSAPSDDSSSNVTPTEQQSSTPTATQINDVTDLDKLEKFMFEGKEWTKDDLRRSILMQQDYTRKTQEVANERKSIEQERKYAENVPYDLEKLARDPNLIEQFKRLYPQKYHAAADKILTSLGVAPPKTSAQTSQNSIPDEWRQELDQVKSMVRAYETEKYETQLNSTFNTLKAKYPKAREDVIIFKARAELDAGKPPLTETQFEKLFKDEHESSTKAMDDYYLSKIKDQKAANKKGRDVPNGGETPTSPPKKLSFKEATESAIRDLSNR